MLIGLDFDNTIVCYDNAIARLAEDIAELPRDLPRTKLALRDFLRHTNREPEWTAFQGTLYGPGMDFAEPFTDATAVMQALLQRGHRLVIVSHRTPRPYAGPAYDLHACARRWIATNLAPQGLFFGDDVFFYAHRSEKIASIGAQGCQVFVDDLVEVLTDDQFPKTTRPILFDPHEEYVAGPLEVITRWDALLRLF